MKKGPVPVYPATISGSTDTPLTGESCFLIMPCCNTVCMNLFLRELSNQFPDDIVLLCCDGAAWHKSKMLDVPENIVLFYIPPYTPETNPIGQIWKEIRKLGFKNEVFTSLDKIVDRLSLTICSLLPEIISHITGRSWVLNDFISDSSESLQNRLEGRFWRCGHS